ncbi:MAG: hypothetical protein DMG58_12905 [Acidobacteria bacterium]|nr:MAG: hypothetical protein DMG58_12905 [Acidobacteriota bacterium]
MLFVFLFVFRFVVIVELGTYLCILVVEVAKVFHFVLIPRSELIKTKHSERLLFRSRSTDIEYLVLDGRQQRKARKLPDFQGLEE